MAYDDVTVTAAELAEFFGMSSSQVRNLAEDGKIVRAPKRARYLLKASVQKYAEHLRLAASRRGDSTTAAGLTAERARLAKQQADLAALKAATLRGEMVPAVEVGAKWRGMLTTLRSRLLAIPSRVGSGRLPHLSRQEVGLIDDEIRDALEDLSNCSAHGFF